MTNVRPGDRIAITGVSGFVGQILVDLLAAVGYEIVGISKPAEPPVRIADILADYISADLTAGWPSIVGCVDGLVHLAGLSAVGPSFEHPQEYISSNSSMVTGMFEQAISANWQGRVVVVSTGAVYGSTATPAGTTEQSSLLATSPYVVSKLLVEHQSEYYRRRGIDAIVVRPFNHIGPGQREGFIVPDLAAKLGALQRGSALEVGNLDSARDYTDARDVARAYRLLLEHPQLRYTTYNVCSGEAHTGWEILDALCKAMQQPKPSTVKLGQRLLDPSIVAGNSQRLRMETGWKPLIDLQTSIDDFVTFGRTGGPSLREQSVNRKEPL